MPVAAVNLGGSPSVSSGSRIAVRGIIRGWKMIFLVWVTSSVITPARPTSLPVPAVVGMATTGAIPSPRARVHQSPTSSKSHKGRSWPAMKATTLPQSNALPPPSATTPSWPPAANARTPASTLPATGFGRTSVNRPPSRPPARRISSRAGVTGRAASPGSVTTSGRAMPACSQARAALARLPAP